MDFVKYIEEVLRKILLDLENDKNYEKRPFYHKIDKTVVYLIDLFLIFFRKNYTFIFLV